MDETDNLSIGHDLPVPEKYVYVCLASRHAIVNLIPVFHLGKKRVAKVVILCGVRDKNKPSVNEQSEAIKPFQWFREFSKTQLKCQVETFFADPDSFSAWKEAAAFIEAEANGLPVLCNFTGGTKQMGQGLAYFLGRRGLPFMIALVTKYPARVMLIHEDGDNTHEHVAPIQRHVPIKLSIECKGVRVDPDPPEDVALRQLCEDRDDGVQALLERALPHGRDDWNKALSMISAINKASYAAPQDGPLRLDEACRNFLDPGGRMGLFVNASTTGRVTRRFATGVWLEYCVYRRVQKALEGSSEAEVLHAVPLQAIGTPERLDGTRDRSTDIDVLIRKWDQLHFVEVKAITAAGDMASHLNRLSNWKARLGGAPSQAWLVAPFIRNLNADQKKSWTKRAEGEGVRLLIGRDALDILIEDVLKLP